MKNENNKKIFLFLNLLNYIYSCYLKLLLKKTKQLILQTPLEEGKHRSVMKI